MVNGGLSLVTKGLWQHHAFGPINAIGHPRCASEPQIASDPGDHGFSIVFESDKNSIARWPRRRTPHWVHELPVSAGR